MYKQSADAEDVGGIGGLGVCYENGIGVQKNISTAITYYKKAADSNHAYSLDRLYRLYREGDGVTKDTDAAITYLRQAADLGNTSSIYSLGYEYYAGEIIHADKQKALEYMKKSADEGYTFACAVLGTMYYSGEEGMAAKDYKKAFEYLSIAVKDAASLNEDLLAEVYKNLGACYRFGRGTDKDQSLASYYTEQAAKYGDKSSVDAVKMMRK